MKRLFLALAFLPSLAAAQAIKPIGTPFGAAGSWQLGFDASKTAQTCGGYVTGRKVAVAGPCRDFLVLTHRTNVLYALNGAALYGPGTAPLYAGTLEAYVGPVLQANLGWVGEYVPYAASAVNALPPSPVWLDYLGKVTSVQVGPIYDGSTHRVFLFAGGQLALPLSDVQAALKALL